MQATLQITFIGVLTALMCILLRAQKKEFAFIAGAAGSILLFMNVMPVLRGMIEELMSITAHGEIGESAQLCLKAALITLLCEFAASFCRDAGENMLAGRIEFGARVFLCAMCVPVMSSLVASLSSLPLFS